MMDVLGGLLKSAAPALATAVAGPLGGVALKAIAGKLGVEDSVEAVLSTCKLTLLTLPSWLRLMSRS